METTLAQSAAQVSRLSQGHWDRTIPASQMEFPDFSCVVAQGQPYRLLPSAKRLVAQRLRIPAEYLERCPKPLQAENLNHWLRRLDDTPLFCRFNDQSMRAVFTPRYKPINNTDIMTRVQEAFPPDTKVEFRLSNELMLLNIPNYQQVFNISGDRIAPGTNFSNSEVGLVAYSCSVFYQRLICTNGLITADTIAVKTRHIKHNALDDFESTMTEVRRLAFSQRDKMALSVESHVDDPLSSLNAFGKRFGLAKDEITLVEDAWQKEPGSTLWHIIQAFTAVARGEYLPAEQAYRFQRIGGQILALVK